MITPMRNKPATCPCCAEPADPHRAEARPTARCGSNLAKVPVPGPITAEEEPRSWLSSLVSEAVENLIHVYNLRILRPSMAGSDPP